MGRILLGLEPRLTAVAVAPGGLRGRDPADIRSGRQDAVGRARRRGARTPSPAGVAAVALLVGVALLAAIGVAIACSPSADGGTARLVVTGSSTLAPLVAELAQRYDRVEDAVVHKVDGESVLSDARRSELDRE